MPVEFLGIATTNDASETTERTTAAFDPAYLEAPRARARGQRLDARLFAYGSSGPEPAALAAYTAARLQSIELLLAHRPNVSYPTYAAKTFATLDQLSGGRLSVHFITGGNDHEQGREGDTLTKDERYARTQEYIQIVKQAWSSAESFDHQGPFYDFDDFVLDAKPFEGRTPTISFGGSSDAAFRVGAAEADIYAVWGEPLDRTAEQIARVHDEAAAAAGRTTPPRIHAAFRPIVAPTEELAWEKAHRILDRIEVRKAAAGDSSAVGTRSTSPRTRARSACSRSPPRASASTPRCGPRPRRPPAAPATRTRSSARPSRSPRRSSPTTTSACASSPRAATTCSTTRSTSVATSSRSSARRWRSATPPPPRPPRPDRSATPPGSAAPVGFGACACRSRPELPNAPVPAPERRHRQQGAGPCGSRYSTSCSTRPTP